MKIIKKIISKGGIAFTKNDRITAKTAVPEESAEAAEQRETVAASLQEEKEKWKKHSFCAEDFRRRLS